MRVCPYCGSNNTRLLHKIRFICNACNQEFKKEKIKLRNEIAISAHFRKAGPMKHRNKERGGAKSRFRFIDEE